MVHTAHYEDLEEVLELLLVDTVTSASGLGPRVHGHTRSYAYSAESVCLSLLQYCKTALAPKGLTLLYARMSKTEQRTPTAQFTTLSPYPSVRSVQVS